MTPLKALAAFGEGVFWVIASTVLLWIGIGIIGGILFMLYSIHPVAAVVGGVLMLAGGVGGIAYRTKHPEKEEKPK